MLIDAIDEILNFVKTSNSQYRKSKQVFETEFIYSEKPYYIPFKITVYRSSDIECEYDEISDLKPGLIVPDRLYLCAGVTPIEEPENIEVDIYISPIEEESLYDLLYMALIDYVSHEFRHIIQHLYNPTGIIPKPTDIETRKKAYHNRYEYTMLPDESDALLYGWQKLAEYRNVELNMIITDNLNFWLSQKEISKKQHKLLFKHFIEA